MVESRRAEETKEGQKSASLSKEGREEMVELRRGRELEGAVFLVS